MTLLVALKSQNAIVMAHDLKTRGNGRYEWAYFKSRILGFGTMCMYTTTSVASAAALVQRVMYNAEEQVRKFGDPWHYADVLATTIKRVYSKHHGRSWWDSDTVPRSVFVVAGWRRTDGAPPAPELIRLPWQTKYEPELYHDILPLTEGDDGIAEHFLLNHFAPRATPLTVDQMITLACFLIQESSQSLEGVGNLPWIQVLGPDDVQARFLTREEAAAHFHAAACIEVDVTNVLHHHLGFPLMPPPPFIPPTKDA